MRRFLIACCLALMTAGCAQAAPPEKPAGAPLQVWQAIAQRLDQAAIDSLDGLLFGQAWSDLLCLDVQQWQQYEVLQSAQHERKAIVQVQFRDLDQPVVLAFCQVPDGPWLLSGLYVRGARWIYQPDWPEVLEKGQWPQFLHCP